MLNQTAVIRATQNLMRELLQPDLNLVEYLRYVMDQTLEVLEFDVGWLLLQEGDWLKVVAADRHHLADVGRSLPLHDSVSGYSMLHKTPINIPNLAEMPDELRRIYKSPTDKAMRSELVLPLVIGDHALGAFNIESGRPGTFDAEHVEILSLFVSHVAAAVALARLRQEASALSSVGLDLSQQTEMDAVVRSVLAHALELVQGQFGQVLLREEEKLVVRYTTNQPPGDLGLAVDAEDSISGLALREHRPVIVPDVTRCDSMIVNAAVGRAGWTGELIPRQTPHPLYKRALEADKAGMHAEYALPLWSAGSLIGVLNVETPRPSGFSAQQRQALLDFVTAQAGHLAEGVLHSRPQRLMELLQQALACVDTGFGQVLRYDGDDLTIEQSTGGERVGTRVPVARSVTGRVVRTRAPVYVPDVAQDGDYQRYLGGEMKSELVVPLFIGEEAIGVLNIESPIPGFFTVDHARILGAFAGQAAVAIDRTRKFESQKLAELGGLAGDIVHRLNNPLGAIAMRLELLQKKPFYPDMRAQYPYLDQFVERIQADLTHAKLTIQELRLALKTQGADLRPVELKAAIAQALEKAGLPDAVETQLRLEGDLRVMANDRLANVFWNLFDNARKAMPRGGQLSVSAEPAPDAGWVQVRVQDSGRGIQPWRLDLIFEPEETTPGDPYAPAHGLGLWWTKAQVESFGGSISVESQEGAGTCVTLKLRRAFG